jgi:hypothetical protein
MLCGQGREEAGVVLKAATDVHWFGFTVNLAACCGFR